MILPEITAPLDARIAPLVEALRADGWPTTQSCDGEGSGYIKTPWVNIEVAPYNALTRARVGQELLKHWLRRRNIYANVCVIDGTMYAPEHYPFIRIEILSDLPTAEDLK